LRSVDENVDVVRDVDLIGGGVVVGDGQNEVDLHRRGLDDLDG